MVFDFMWQKRVLLLELACNNLSRKTSQISKHKHACAHSSPPLSMQDEVHVRESWKDKYCKYVFLFTVFGLEMVIEIEVLVYLETNEDENLN